MKNLKQYINEAFRLRDDTKIVKQKDDEPQEKSFTKEDVLDYVRHHGIFDKTWSTQEAKMEAWHEGRRKQNITACSDKKLKLNYAICVARHYDEQAELLRREIDARGLTFKS